MIDDQNVEDFAILDYMKFLYSKSQESLQAFQSYRDYDQNDNHHNKQNWRSPNTHATAPPSVLSWLQFLLENAGP